MSAPDSGLYASGGNYKGGEMAHVEECVAGRLGVASADGELDGHARQLFRAALATLPRGKALAGRTGQSKCSVDRKGRGGMLS